ncbi:putative Arenavirus glycoprotein [Prochlorococcus marinus str. MIT 9123]|nr:putative Arenavirus glycoprotein [Prochlorococcus marinus str. MIT 9123]
MLEENIVLKWVHRFGIDSLNDLLIHSSALRGFHHEEENQEQITLIDENHEEENQGQITLIDENHEEENQEQITLIDENHEEENQEQIRLESLKTLENLEETNCESNYLKISNNNEVFNTKQDSNQVNQYIETPKLPLPNIKNLRKWINKDKKAS